MFTFTLNAGKQDEVIILNKKFKSMDKNDYCEEKNAKDINLNVITLNCW